MRKLRKCTSCFLCICLILSGFIPTTLAQVSYDYGETAELLLKLGVLEKVEKPLDSPITRGEIADMVSDIVSDVQYNTETKLFSDVEAEHPCADGIAVLADAGIMNGYSDGTFRPDATVTESEALKVFVSILGYGPIIEHWGGYPQAYYRAALQSDLLKNINSDASDVLTYGEAIQLLYNTVTADKWQVVGVSGEQLQIDICEGVNILSERYKIEKYSGIMTATDVTSLTGGFELSENTVRIGNVDFRMTEDKDFSDCLGYYVDCYYSTEDSPYEVVLITKDNKKNNELVVKANKIVSVPYEGRPYLKYETADDDIKNQTISDRADLIYNGKAYSDFTFSDMDIKSGYLTLIDNNGDHVTDVISVTEFDTVVVKAVSEDEQKIYSAYGNNIKLDEDEKNSRIVDKNGNRIALKDIANDTVLSVARSKDEELVFAIIEVRAIIGTVEQIETTDGKITACAVNDNIYELTPELQNQILTEQTQRSNFALGASARYALTHDGKIAYSFSGENGAQYGFLLKAYVNANSLREKNGQFRILTQNNEVVVYEGAEKIKFNGVPMSAETAVNKPEITDENGEIIQQLIKYEINTKNEIKTIYTAKTNVTDNFEDEVFYSKEIAKDDYRTSEKTIQDFTISEDTYVFAIEKRNSKGRIDAEDILIYPSFLKSSVDYKAILYDYDYHKEPKAIVVEAADASAEKKYDRHPFILKSKKQISTSDGEEKTKLIGFYRGQPTEYILSDDCQFSGTSLSGLSEGDGIFCYINNTSEVSYIKLAFDISEDLMTDRQTLIKGTSFETSSFSITVGNITKYGRVSMGVRRIENGKDVLTAHTITKNSVFYLYDSTALKGDRVRVVTSDELIPETDAEPGSRVVMVNLYSQTYAIMIIR